MVGICPAGICPGGICPGGICPAGICPDTKETYVNKIYLLFHSAEDITPPIGKRDDILQVVPKTNHMSDGEEEVVSDDEEMSDE